MLLEYPSTWQPVAGAPAIPGLPIAHALLLAPGGDPARAGLLSGQLPGGEPSPLPRQFLALLRGIPRTAIAQLLVAQAYDYSQLSISGYDKTLNVYVIPNPGGPSTALACYASPGLSIYLRQCQQIVAKLTLVGRPSPQLNPDAGYAGQLSGLIGALDKERLTLRHELSNAATPAVVGRLATALDDRFAATAASLAGLEQPLAAGPAQASLVDAILRASETYKALAAAATAENLARYDTVRGQVIAAEASVNTALENFALLGYNHT